MSVLDTQWQLTPQSMVELKIPKFKLTQAFMVVLVTGKNEKDPIENKRTRVLTTFSTLWVMGIFSNAQGQLTPQSLPAKMKNIISKMKALEC